jgi:hypothetical protein
MGYLRKHGWAAGLAIGLLLGLMIGGLWPDTPLHAVATDRGESYSICTGFVDDGVEAIYFLDFLTGTLSAAVLSNRPQSPGFQARYQGNVTNDLAAVIQARNAGLMQMNAERRKQGLPALPELQVPQSPSYLMVSGVIDMRGGVAANQEPPRAALYVAETTTGIVLAYLIPWNSNAHLANRPVHGPLPVWTGEQFTAALIQTE